MCRKWNIRIRFAAAAITAISVFLSCRGEDSVAPVPDPVSEIYVVPVVVHIVHHGEPEGEGHNLSRERIERQIEILNEDFRRKPGTRGYNEHPDGADTRLEFVLASRAPDGNPTDGIHRVDATAIENPVEGQGLFNYYAHYGYWNPDQYVNIWTMPLAEEMRDIVLGQATGPETDLPGADRFEKGEPHQAEGILIHSFHFGESDTETHYGLGRTLTHEAGHYFGLLHTWGGGDCENNDFCEDTPPVSAPVTTCPATPPPACDGRPVMTENFMNYVPDSCMNIFTKDQVARIRHVMENSPRRKTLPDSPALTPAP